MSHDENIGLFDSRQAAHGAADCRPAPERQDDIVVFLRSGDGDDARRRGTRWCARDQRIAPRSQMTNTEMAACIGGYCIARHHAGVRPGGSESNRRAERRATLIEHHNPRYCGARADGQFEIGARRDRDVCPGRREFRMGRKQRDRAGRQIFQRESAFAVAHGRILAAGERRQHRFDLGLSRLALAPRHTHIRHRLPAPRQQHLTAYPRTVDQRHRYLVGDREPRHGNVGGQITERADPQNTRTRCDPVQSERAII